MPPDPPVEAVETNPLTGPDENVARDVPDPVQRESAPDRPGSSSSAGSDEPAVRDTEWALEQRRAELDAEPRDDSWAYYMEETLTQFLARHPGIVEFDVSYVECRTSYCQLQVIGFDASTEPTWSRIMYDLRQALPEQTAAWGTSSYDLEGRHAIVTTLSRAR